MTLYKFQLENGKLSCARNYWRRFFWQGVQGAQKVFLTSKLYLVENMYYLGLIMMIINHRVSFKYRDKDKFKIYYQMIIKKFFFISITGCCLEIYSKGWKTRKRAKKSEKRDRYYEKFTS